MRLYSVTRLAPLFLCLVAACAAWAPAPAGGVDLPVAFVPQGAPTLCGVAALAMLTAYYQRPLAPGAWADLRAQASAPQGLSGAQLQAALRGAGYAVTVFKGALDQRAGGLYRHLDRRRPVIVMTGLPPRHYLLVSGYDARQGTLRVLDPAQGPLTLGLAAFQRRWDQAHDFALLAVPGGGRE